MKCRSCTPRFLLAVAALLSTAIPPGSAAPGSAQERSCPDGTAPRADPGIRIRFRAGDFVDEEGRPRWIHFLSEPVVMEVDSAGPAAGRLLPGDIIVAVDRDLITTRNGSFRFWFGDGDSLRIALLRDARPIVRWIRPVQECVPVGRP